MLLLLDSVVSIVLPFICADVTGLLKQMLAHLL